MANGVIETAEESIAPIWIKLIFVVSIVPVAVMFPLAVMLPEDVIAPELITPEIPTAPSMLSVPESSALKVPAIIKSSLIVTAVESTDDISLTSKTFTLKVPEPFRSS